MKYFISNFSLKSLAFLVIAAFSNTAYSEQSFGRNIFDSECNSNSNGYNNCSFNKINLNNYSIKMQNEFDFTVNYEFKNCNFNYLNATFYTLKDFHRITSGTNKVKLTGNSILIKDPYVWDTNTNEYNRTCRFIINNIQASLSTYTVHKIDRYVKLISEYNTILQMISNLETMFHTLNSLVNQISSYNVSFQLKAIEEDLKNGLSKYDDPVWKAQIEMLLFEIEQFKTYNQFHNNADYMQIRKQITELIKGLLLDINTININERINSNKQKALAILNELSSYPNYDNQQYVKYKNILEM